MLARQYTMRDPNEARCSTQSVDPPTIDEIHHRLQAFDQEWLAGILLERWRYLQQDTECLELRRLLNEQAPVARQDMTVPSLPKTIQISEYVNAFRSFDWSSTGLGRMSTWSPCMRRITNWCMNDKRACGKHIMLFQAVC